MYKEEIVIYREGSLEQDKAESSEEDETSLLARPPLEDNREGLQEQTDRVQSLLPHLPLLTAHLEVSVDGCHCKVDHYWNHFETLGLNLAYQKTMTKISPYHEDD